MGFATGRVEMPLHAPRRKMRLPNHDYASTGAYFVTIRAQGGAAPFGSVVYGAMRLTEVGQLVEQTWRWLALHYAYVELDEFCLMPDHLHGIVAIVDRATATEDPNGTTQGPRKSLG